MIWFITSMPIQFVRECYLYWPFFSINKMKGT